MLFKVFIAFAVVAAADFLYQRWSFDKEMRMTKHEVKEEYKQIEGDPKIKGKMKEKQQKDDDNDQQRNCIGRDGDVSYDAAGSPSRRHNP